MSLFNLPTAEEIRQRDAEIIKKAKKKQKSDIKYYSLDAFAANLNTEVLKDFCFLDSIEKLEIAIGELLEEDYVALKTLNAEISNNKKECIGIALSNSQKSYSILFNNFTDIEELKKYLVKLQNIKLVGYKTPSEINILRKVLQLDFIFYWDTYIAAKLLNENEKSFKISALCKKYKLNLIPELEPTTTFLIKDTYDSKVGQVYGEYARQINLLYAFQAKHLTFSKMPEVYTLFQAIEMPCTKVIANMEQRGICFDQDKYDKYSKKYTDLLLNNSTSKLKGHYQKIVGTYLKPLLSYVENGKVYTKFDQYGTVSGRITSYNPSLQQFPARGEAKEIRQIFKADDGFNLIAADFSAQEPRLTAQLSQDPEMLFIYNNNRDLYAEIASTIFNKSYEDCLEFDTNGNLNSAGKMRRDKAKIVWLSIIYGVTTLGLAKQLKCPEKEAKEFKSLLFKRFKKLKEFEDRELEKAKTNKYVTTLWGRKRRFPIFKEQKPNTEELEKAERQVVNSVVQGSGADMLKKALILIENDNILQKLGLQLLFPIYDEIIAQCPIENTEECCKRLQYLMNTCANDKVSVPIKSDIKISINWGG